MEWINIKTEKPQKSEPFLISISKKITSGEYIFNYYAFYNAELDKWHEYDSKNNKVGKIITDKVVGWLKGLTNYLG